MGFSNGNLTSKAVKVQKGDRGKPGEGLSLTVDSHFHIKKNRSAMRTCVAYESIFNM